MIKLSDLTADDLSLLSYSRFADCKLADIPANWRELLEDHPAILRSEQKKSTLDGYQEYLIGRFCERIQHVFRADDRRKRYQGRRRRQSRRDSPERRADKDSRTA